MAVASLTGYAPKRRYDLKPWVSARLEGATATGGPWTTVETFPFANVDVDADPSAPAIRSFTTELVNPVTTTYLRVVFLDDDSDQDISDPLPLSASGDFTTIETVTTRLARVLTDVENAQVALFISGATAMQKAVLGVNPLTWLPPREVRPILDAVCAEIVCRQVANPLGLFRKRETIGTYTEDLMFSPRNAAAPGLIPTTSEELLMRNAVFGSNAASWKVTSLADDVVSSLRYSLYWQLVYGFGDDGGGGSSQMKWI